MALLISAYNVLPNRSFAPRRGASEIGVLRPAIPILELSVRTRLRGESLSGIT
jgi:hypothetical protein